MFAFVVNLALLLFVLTQHSPFIVSPAMLPKGNLTKILDILNGKFGVTKKNTTAADRAQSTLTEKERKLMETLMNRLYKRVIDGGLGTERAVESRVRGGVNDVGENGRLKHVTRVDGGADDDEYADAAMNFGLTRQAFVRDHTTPRPDAPAGITASSGKRDDVDRRLSADEGAAAVAPGPSDPLLERFARLADMLDRPDGVNEAVRTMLAVPSFLNRSAVLDERCPIDRLVDDDERLVSSIIRRLRRLHGFKSGHSVLMAD